MCVDQNVETKERAIETFKKLVFAMDKRALPHSKRMTDRLHNAFRAMVEQQRFVHADFFFSCGIDIDLRELGLNSVTNESFSLSMFETAIVSWPVECVEYLLNKGADKESKSEIFGYAIAKYHMGPEQNRGRYLSILKLLIMRRNYSVNSSAYCINPRANVEKGSFIALGVSVAELMSMWAQTSPYMMDIFVFLMFYRGERDKIVSDRMHVDVREALDSIYRANKAMPDELLLHVSKFLL